MADQTVPMISPDGKDVADVPIAQVEHFKSLGAKVVEAPPPPSLGRRFAKGALDSLPGIGGVVGGVVSTPETGGVGTIPGIALGAGIGRGVRDLIGHYSGLDEPTSATQKAFNIAGDTAMTAMGAKILPGLVAAAKTPIQTLREASDHFSSVLPQSVQKLGKLLPSLPAPPANLPESPAGMTGWGEPMPGSIPPADKALLAKQGYSPELIQRIEQDAIARAAKPPNSAPSRPPISVAPSSPMQPPPPAATPPAAATPAAPPSDLLQQLKDSLAARTAPSAPAPVAPIRSIEGRPAPLYASAGHAKGVTSNALEAASNRAFAEGHYDEAERLIGQSLQAFSTGGPMLGVLAAAIAHKARQIVEPLRADPAFQSAAPAKQQQMIQQALRQPGARGSLTSLLGS